MSNWCVLLTQPYLIGGQWWVHGILWSRLQLTAKKTLNNVDHGRPDDAIRSLAVTDNSHAALLASPVHVVFLEVRIMCMTVQLSTIEYLSLWCVIFIGVREIGPALLWREFSNCNLTSVSSLGCFTRFTKLTVRITDMTVIACNEIRKWKLKWEFF